MNKYLIIFTLCLLILSCDNRVKKNKGVASERLIDTLIRLDENINKGQNKVKLEESYLIDTIKVYGNSIIVLRPDSLRFQSYLNNGEEWIYEVDSDFGFSFLMALDSFNLLGVEEHVTQRRYVEILDCKNGPIVIDRDTIDYGVILTAPGRDIEVDQNLFGGEYYIDLFKKYF